MRKILTSCAILIAGFSFAQVSISGDATHTPRATLDVKEIENSSVPNGIIIPNVSRYEAEHMPKPTKSTLAYIKDVSGVAGSRTGKVDAEGFYYFDGTEWVKVGSGAATLVGPVKGQIRSVALPVTPENWTSTDFALVVSGDGSIGLPNPADNKGRIVAVNNQANRAKNFGDNAPINLNTIDAGTGMLIMCDGSNWYVIAGLY